MSTQFEHPGMELAIMSRWYVVSRAIHTIARLGIADHMSLSPTPCELIAKHSETVPTLLRRLLCFLSDYGVFERQGDAFALTPLSLPLQSDAPNSLRDVLCMVDEDWWQSFGCMDKMLKSGRPGYEERHGAPFFEHLGKHPEKQANFDRGMAKLSDYDDTAIADSVDISRFKTIADIGGGRGGLTRALAKKNHASSVILFDTPQVINQLDPGQFPKNVELLSGNFFETLPRADAYIYKGVLHDFNDADMRQILSNCACQMPASATLLIAEQVMPDSASPHPNKTMDMVMMVLLGGRQRTLSEWQNVVEPLGFVFIAALSTPSLFRVMEFKRKP